MKAYRALWLTICVPTTVVGVSVAVLVSVPAVFLIFGTAALIGAGVTIAVLRQGEDVWPDELQRRGRSSALLSGTATVAFFGIAALMGVAALLVAILLAGTSPPAVRRFRRRRTPVVRGMEGPGGASMGSAPEVEAQTVSTPPSDPCSLSDAELCAAWRASFTMLQKASTLSQRLRVVDGRQRYLDEIEQRYPSGLTAWLASGARAAGDPSRFVVGDGPGRGPIDWDSLIHGSDK